MSATASIPSDNPIQPKNAPIPGANFLGIKGSAAIPVREIAEKLNLPIITIPARTLTFTGSDESWTMPASWTLSEEDWTKVQMYPIYVYGADGKPAEKNGNPIQDNVFRIRVPKGEVFDFEKSYTVGGISLSIADNKSGNIIVAPALPRMPTYPLPKPYVAPPFNAQPPLPELPFYQPEPVPDETPKPYMMREDAPEDQTLWRIVLPEKDLASLALDFKALVKADLHDRSVKIRDTGAALWNDLHKAAVSLIPHTKKNEPPVDIFEPTLADAEAAAASLKASVEDVTEPVPSVLQIGEGSGQTPIILGENAAEARAAETPSKAASPERGNILSQFQSWAGRLLSPPDKNVEKTPETKLEPAADDSAFEADRGLQAKTPSTKPKVIDDVPTLEQATEHAAALKATSNAQPAAETVAEPAAKVSDIPTARPSMPAPVEITPVRSGSMQQDVSGSRFAEDGIRPAKSPFTARRHMLEELASPPPRESILSGVLGMFSRKKGPEEPHPKN